MTPYEEAKAVYSRESCKRTFEVDLHLHHLHGYVFSTPTFFIMGRAVEKDAPYVLVTDPAVKFKTPDCWLVYLAAGDMRHFFKVLPYYLPWLAWERENKLRYHQTQVVERALCKVAKTTSEPLIGFFHR